MIVVTGLLVLAAPALCASYQVRYLAAPETAISRALGISDPGLIAGYIDDPKRAVVWQDASSSPRTLSEDGVARAVSNSGKVAGRYYEQGYPHTFVWASGEGLREVATPADWDVTVYAVNDGGEIAGDARIGSAFRAVVLSDEHGGLLLPTLGGSESQARDINDVSAIAGSSMTEAGDPHASIWRKPDEIVDLGTMGGSWSTAEAISNSGLVAGVFGDTGGEIRAFLWSEQFGPVVIPKYPLLDDGYFYPLAVNDGGMVVGGGNVDGVDMVVVWSAESGFNLVGRGCAYDINNPGWIAGYDEQNGIDRPVVWEPIPEPSSLAALAIGLVPLAAAIRRRAGDAEQRYQGQ